MAEGDDFDFNSIFLSQRVTNNNVTTQEANKAADFLLNANDDLNSTGEVIEYFDFSKENESVPASNDMQNSRRTTDDNSAKMPLEAENLFNKAQEEISDFQLSQILDKVEVVLGINRFGPPVSDDIVADNSMKKFTPSTEKKADWAFKMYTDWVVARNYTAQKNGSSVTVSSDLLSLSAEDLCYNVCRFILEVRKVNGDDYPSDTLYELVLALQHYMRSKGSEVKFLDDPTLDDIKNTLDNRMKQLCSEGKFAKCQKADIITDELEEILWQKGLLGEDSPKQLSDTLVYLFGMHFALHAGQEHKNLRVGPNSQLRLKHDDKLKLWYVEYSEDVSKTNQGGLDHRKVSRKVVRAYQNEVNPDRCVVHYYKKYLAVRPKSDNCPDDFYLCPLQVAQDGVWFYSQPIGRYRLSCIIGDMCKTAGFLGKFTNHSLRASCASRLYHNNVDEQLICEKTDHRSDSVRSYKRTSDGQLKQLSDILYGNKVDVQNVQESCPKKVKVETCNAEVSRTCEHRDDQDPPKGSAPVVVNVNVTLK